MVLDRAGTELINLSRASLDETFIGGFATLIGTVILTLIVIFVASKIWKFKFNIKYVIGAIAGSIIGLILLRLFLSLIMSLIVQTQVLIYVGTIVAALFSSVGLISLDEGFLFGITGAYVGWILLTTVLGAVIIPKLIKEKKVKK
jgi:hypothetical protein